jgi:hypothetical protein
MKRHMGIEREREREDGEGNDGTRHGETSRS